MTGLAYENGAERCLERIDFAHSALPLNKMSGYTYLTTIDIIREKKQN